MSSEIVQIKSEIKNIDAIWFALFYHDIIYKATKSDNELQSAKIFKKRIVKTKFDQIGFVQELIEQTKHHKISNNNDINLFLDIDLSILGSERDVYIQYFNNVRKEFKMYPKILYKKGRKKVLQQILNEDVIYKTKYFKDKFEIQARNNLTFELNRL